MPLRAIWNDACDEHHWDLPDPFRNISKHLPRGVRKRRTVFRFDEWMRLLEHLDPHYRLIAEVMVLTGMISSEIAGLRKCDIGETHIEIQNSMVRGQDKGELKTPYRHRRIPITEALRRRLDTVIAQAEGEHLFTMKVGGPFLEGSFRQNPWTKAFKRAGLDYKVPYTMRHTFAAWSLTVGMDPNRLVRLMGHGSKQMVYEVYGDYVEGLEEDRGKIMAYYGEDFLGRKNKRHPIPRGTEWRKSGESGHLRVVK